MLKLKIDPKELETRSPNSISCKFIPLNSEWGVKMYKYLSYRDEAFDNQTDCFEALPGRFPEAKDCFELGYGTYRFGYFTEILEAFVEYCYDDCLRDDDKMEEIRNKRRDAQPLVDELRSVIKEKTRWQLEDAHSWNLAWKNGMLTTFDFGV